MKVAICEDDRIQAGALESLIYERLRETEYESDVDVYLGAGVLDSLLEHHISFPYVIGVSAGSGNAVNFIAGQEGRTKKVITHENADAYYGLGTLRNNGKVLDLDQMLAYDKEPLNFDSFFASDVEREFVAVNCETGKAEYLTDDGTAESILQDRKSTRLNSSHSGQSRMPSSA